MRSIRKKCNIASDALSWFLRHSEPSLRVPLVQHRTPLVGLAKGFLVAGKQLVGAGAKNWGFPGGPHGAG